jgi:hypothetical protein
MRIIGMNVTVNFTVDAQAIGKGNAAGDTTALGNQALDCGLLLLIEHFHLYKDL